MALDGMRFYYDYASPLGTLRIEENGHGLTAITLVEMGCASLSARTKLSAMDETPLIRCAVVQLQEYFTGQRSRFDLPLAPEGTPFQHRVWSLLRSVPYGQTVTYGEIAARMGNPKAARAVGMANNRNPLMIIVPCHRVIGTKGKLVGYAYGLDIKAFLLDLERNYSKRAYTDVEYELSAVSQIKGG